MNALQEFLVNANISEQTQEIDLGGRLAGHKFKIRPLSGSDFNRLQNLCLEFNKQHQKKFNRERFNEQIILTCVIDPNLKDVEMLKKAGCATAEQLMYKVFLAGELTALTEKILEISGFGNTLAEDINEAKNS